MDLNREQGPDEAAMLPSDSWLLHDLDTLPLDNDLFDFSYDVSRLDEPMANPSFSALDAGDVSLMFLQNDVGSVTDNFLLSDPITYDPGPIEAAPANTLLPLDHDSSLILPAQTALPATAIFSMPFLETSSAPQPIRSSRLEFKRLPFKPIAPKESSAEDSSLSVLGPFPPTSSVHRTMLSNNLKRKRSLSIDKASGFSCFSVNPSLEATRTSKKRPNGLTYSKHTCLRCQVSRKKCSGTFPCENCLAAWENKATKATLNIQACFDSDVTELNGFNTLWDAFFIPGITVFDLCPQHEAHTPEWEAGARDVFIKLGTISKVLKSGVAHAMVDAGLAEFLLQERWNDEFWDDGDGITLQLTADSDFCPQSSYWILAVIHLHAAAVSRLIGTSEFVLWALREMLSDHLFKRVSFLIRKFKSEPWNMTSEHRNELRWSLIVLDRVPWTGAFINTSFFFFRDSILPAARRQSNGREPDDFGETELSTLTDTFLDQQERLQALAHYWICKLSPDLLQDYTYVFQLALLSRLDMSQKPKKPQDPIDQAIKFLSDYKIELSRADIAALQWEKQHQTLGALKRFGDYFPLLDTLKESMAASQRGGAFSNSPSRRTEQ